MTLAKDNPVAFPLISGVYLIAIRLVSYGHAVQGNGKKYYRRADHNRILIERELGLLRPIPSSGGGMQNLSLGVTSGQHAALTRLVSEVARSDAIAPLSMIGLIKKVLDLYRLLAILGVLVCWLLFFGHYFDKLSRFTTYVIWPV